MIAMRHYRMLSVLWLLLLPAPGRGQAPVGWEVNPSSYEHFMTMTGTLLLSGGGAADSAYYVAAFSGSQCRGVSQPVFILDRWVFFLMMYGDVAEEVLTLRAYDTRSGLALGVDEQVSFQISGSLGIPADPFTIHATPTGVRSLDDAFPLTSELHEPFPNPFNPSTHVRFTTASSGVISIVIFDLTGRLVRRLAEGNIPAGVHIAVWNGRDSDGMSVPSGAYFCRMVFERGDAAGRIVQTRRLLLLQ